MPALIELASRLRIDFGEPPETVSVGADEHGDMSVQSEITEHLLMIRQNEGQIRVRVDHAIDLARKGLRGVCEDCSKKIPAARLEAVPYATRCVTCESEQEGA